MADNLISADILDCLVLTAANERQASGYRMQLEVRQRSGQLVKTHALVVTDPGGRRVGSGGSTLVALRHILEALPPAASVRDAFAGRRVFILHAGGDSKRLPAYAAEGKLFTPLPCETASGWSATLFDLLLQNLLQIAKPPAGHLLIASGDVLLTFDARELVLNQPGVTGVAFGDGEERAARHGVYVADRDGLVTGFLQKPTAAELRAHSALNAGGQALIDTGLFSFDPSAVETLCQAAGMAYRHGKTTTNTGLVHEIEAGRASEIDIYEEIALALVSGMKLDEYCARIFALPRNANPRQQARLRELFAALHGLPFQVQILSYCDFLHLGSSRELLAGLSNRSRHSSRYHFQNGVHAVLPSGFPADRAFAFNSHLTGEMEAGPGCLVEGVEGRGGLRLAGRNIINGVPGSMTRPIRLPESVGLVMLPVGRRIEWVAVIYGVDDDFRGVDEACTFLNQPIHDFIQRNGLAPEMLWPKDSIRSLYHARLWCVAEPNEALAHVEWIFAATGRSAAKVVASWKKQKRLSMAELVRQVDYHRLLAHRENLHRLWLLHEPFARLKNDPDFPGARLVQQVRTQSEAAALASELAVGFASACEPSLQARVAALTLALKRHVTLLPKDTAAQRLLNAAVTRITGEETTEAALGRAASAAVAAAVGRQVPTPTKPPHAGVERDQVVWVTAPARLDFAGGWSDTPPICTDRGGAVVNAAVTLNGQYPLQAIAKLNDDYEIHLNSIDLGQRLCLTRLEELQQFTDPGQWSSLPRACLALMGFMSGRKSAKLRDILRKFGGGIDLTIFSALPKGSGLGASSILGAAVLACLARLCGQELSQAELIQRTSLLEQLMTTGGGWQDQVGGVLPGVKLSRTEPGPVQIPVITWLAFDPTFAAGRLLLYYTGLKRLAKNILQNVVHNYLLREPHVLRIIHDLKAGANQVRQAIETRDLAAFGHSVRQYWELKKGIDPGSTTPAIDQLLTRIDPWCHGYTLLGAGGGGFLFIIARDDAAANHIRAELTSSPPHPGARFFEFTIDTKGLAVSVL